MKYRLFGRVGLGLVAVLTFSVAGCADEGTPDTSADGTDTTTTTTTDDPKLTLVSSADAFDETSFKFDMTMGDTLSGSGQMDPAASTGAMTMSINTEGITMNLEYVITETEIYLNLGEMGSLLGAGSDWLRLDLSQLGEEGLLGIDPEGSDPSGAAELLAGLGEVEKVDDHTYRGELDLTSTDSAVVDEEMLAEWGDGAAAAPFTATLDDEGRLTKFTLDMPAMAGQPAQTMEITYYDFGAPVDITLPPADQVSDMPLDLLELLNA